MKKKICGMCIFLTGSLFFSGCGSVIPEMTEEQTALVTEYAAGLLLKYDKNHVSRLVDTTLSAEEGTVETTSTSEETGVAEETAISEGTEETDAIEGQDPGAEVSTEEMNDSSTDTVVESATNEVTGNGSESGGTEEQQIAEFLGLTESDITYVDYEVSDNYPTEASEEVFLTFTAQSGKKLVVLKFELKNTANQSAEINLLSKKATYKVLINDTTAYRALSTYLLEDLATYNEVLAAGESNEVVLVIEMDEADTEEIQSADLSIDYNGSNNIVFLF